MSTPQIYQTEWMEDGSAYVMARLKRPNATTYAMQNVAQADFTSISCAVYDGNGTEVIAPTTLTVSAVIFDTLQTGSLWTKDSTGFNFLHRLAATSFPNGDTIYRAEYKFTLTSGEVFFLCVEGVAVNAMES